MNLTEELSFRGSRFQAYRVLLFFPIIKSKSEGRCHFPRFPSFLESGPRPRSLCLQNWGPLLHPHHPAPGWSTPVWNLEQPSPPAATVIVWPTDQLFRLWCLLGPECFQVTSVQSSQSCPTLCDLVDCSPPDSSVHEISQARILEWGAISSSSSLENPLSTKEYAQPKSWGLCFVWSPHWELQPGRQSLR